MTARGADGERDDRSCAAATANRVRRSMRAVPLTVARYSPAAERCASRPAAAAQAIAISRP